MPKNKGKGGKSYRSGKKFTERTKRELFLKEDGLDYGIVVNVLGGAKIHVRSFSENDIKLGYIRGPVYKREWLLKDDIVLISLRDFEPKKCDIVWKYNNDEVKQLQKMKEIPTDFIAKDDLQLDFIEFADEPDNHVSDDSTEDSDTMDPTNINDDIIDSI